MEFATLSLLVMLAGQFNLSDEISTSAPPSSTPNLGVQTDVEPPYGAGRSTFQLPDLEPATAPATNSNAQGSAPRDFRSVYAPPELRTPDVTSSPEVTLGAARGAPATGTVRSLAEPVQSHTISGSTGQAAGVGATDNAGLASRVLQRALVKSDHEDLPGTDVGLQEVLRRVPNTSKRNEAIRAFWELAVAVATYNFAQEELVFLQSLPAAVTRADQVVLSAERAAARATCSEMKLAALRSQQRLADLIQWPTPGKLPLAADQPFVGAYRTYFETLNARGAAPDRLGKIDRILPAMRGLIDDRAAAVVEAEDCRSELRRACELGQASAETVLRIHAALRHQRRAFLASVRDYNEQIANYALAVAVPGQSEERLAGMLIERPVTTAVPGEERSVLAGLTTQQPIQRVSNEEPMGPPALDPVTPIQVTPSWRRD